MMEWKDATSYSKADRRENAPPRAWRIDLDRDVHIWIGTNNIYHPGQWTMHCSPWFNTKEMGLPPSATVETAQLAALALVYSRIENLSRTLESLLP